MGLKTKLGLAVATSAAGAAMIAGGTFALFTATSQNTGNQFTAGTVQVDATQSGAAVFSSSDVTFNNMAPGDSGTVHLTVNNPGSLGEWVQIDGITTSGNLFATSGTANGASANDPLTLTPNADLPSGNTGYYIAAGSSTTIAINYSLPLGASNFYQGQSGTAVINVEAVQARHNSNDGTSVGNYQAGVSTGPHTWS